VGQSFAFIAVVTPASSHETLAQSFRAILTGRNQSPPGRKQTMITHKPILRALVFVAVFAGCAGDAKITTNVQTLFDKHPRES
jgi:hypothetical protein